MKYLKDESGITLIALVVTIIVLIILAGVSINMLVGENGIITQAQKSKEDTERAEEQEKSDMVELEDEMNESITEIKVEQVTDARPGELEIDEQNLNTYIINSIEDLVFFAYDVTNENKYEGQTVKLGVSLNFNSTKSYVDAYRTDYGEYGYDGELKTLLTTGEGFKPIGTIYDANISTNYFGGTFDGNGNAIYNLYQNIENSEYVTILGLFSTNEGNIRNLKVENIKVNATTNNMHMIFGGVAGRNNGIIEQCSTSGNINIQANGVKSIYAGGIEGQSTSSETRIDQCSSNLKINVNSSNTNSLNISGIGPASEIKNSYFAGAISIVGENSGNKNIAGICAVNSNQSIINCYNIGKIESYFENQNADNLFISGIAVFCPNVENCYNIGKIECQNNRIYIAGIVANAQNGEVNNCHNIGTLTATGNGITIGALTGTTRNQIISNSKWFSASAEKGIGSINTENVTQTNVEAINDIENMPSILSVINSENCFKEDINNINHGYPVLNWQGE